jgi:TonB family protein
MNMHHLKTLAQRIFKSLLFVPMAFAFLLTANAQTVINPSPVSADSLRKAKPDLNNPDKDGVYMVADKVPVYVGGEKALIHFISHNLRYPLDAQQVGIQGTVMVRFVITKLGKVGKAEVLRGLSSSINQEALRVVNLLQDWIPAEQKGEKVSMYYVLPIKFVLEDESKPRSIDPAKKTLMILDGKVAPKDYNFSTLNKDSFQIVDVITPDKKEKLDKLALKYGANTTNGVIIIVTKAYARQHPSAKVEMADDNKVYDVIDQMPQFPGGEPSLISYIGHNLKYPIEAQRKGIQGTVIVRFVVSKTGQVGKVEVLRNVFPALDNESVRVVQSLPDWIPGEQKGVKVNVYYTLPIRFKLQ